MEYWTALLNRRGDGKRTPADTSGYQRTPANTGRDTGWHTSGVTGLGYRIHPTSIDSWPHSNAIFVTFYMAF